MPQPITRTKFGGSSGSSSKPKKKHRGQLFDIPKITRDFLRGGKEAARGLPTGIKVNAKAVMALRHGDPRPIAKLGEQIARQSASDVRHPLRDPFSTFLTGLSLASAGGGTVARVGAGGKALARTGKVSKAVSAAAKKPVYTRSFRGLPARPGAQPKTYTGLAASPNPITRYGRAPLDKAYSVSRKRGEKAQKVKFAKDVDPLRKEARKLTQDIRKLEDRRAALREKGHVVSSGGKKGPVISQIDDDIREAKRSFKDKQKEIRTAEKKANASGPGGLARTTERRTRTERERYAKQAESKEPGSVKVTGETMIPEVINAPMNLLRLGMVLRPRYFAQNLGSSGLMLALQQGPHGIVKSARTARRLRKESPEIPKKVRATMGDPGQASALIETPGRLSAKAQKAAHIANWLEARLREVGYYGPARAEGITKTADFEKLFKNVNSPQFHRIARKSNDAMVDYSRLGKHERDFMRTGVPIFYPMFKGFTRYGMQYPFNHSIQAALVNQIGQQGYDRQQEDFPGGLPPWMPYLTKTGKDRTANFQNIHPFSPAADILEAIAGMGTSEGVDPTRSLLNYVGPAPELAYGAITGNQLQTGWPLKGKDKGQSNLEAALRDFLPTLPLADVAAMAGLVEPRTTKLYGKPSVEEQFLMWLLGPGFPRDTDMRELRNQAKRSQGRNNR